MACRSAIDLSDVRARKGLPSHPDSRSIARLDPFPDEECTPF
jgi:hypothetical protein